MPSRSSQGGSPTWTAEPFLAVPDWRRAPRHTALGGLLDGTLLFGWKPSGGDVGWPTEEAESAIREGPAMDRRSRDVLRPKADRRRRPSGP